MGNPEADILLEEIGKRATVILDFQRSFYSNYKIGMETLVLKLIVPLSGKKNLFSATLDPLSLRFQ